MSSEVIERAGSHAKLTAVAPALGSASGPVLIVNPAEYAQWDSLIANHHDCSFFHSSTWARVLHATYGHAPRYFCTLTDGNLESVLPVMEVSSTVTGRRGVSLPFSDFCAPLGSDERVAVLFEAAMRYGRERQWKYIECRNDRWSKGKASSRSVEFYTHVVDVQDGDNAVLSGFEGAVRRGIKKAHAEGVKVSLSSSLEAVCTFFAIHCRTRRRHGLPPQPRRFFENIARLVLAASHGFVAIAHWHGRPIAGAVFFHFGKEAIYKFGASDHEFQHLRANNLVMWESLKCCAANGATRVHLGRTSVGNEGLRRFKRGFGAQEEKIEYRKYDFSKGAFVTSNDRADTWVNTVFRKFPPPLLRIAGELIYPHLS